jgi:hypothetical protein
MGMKFDGFDKLEKKFKQMESVSKELSEEKEVSFKELFDTDFMSKYTEFKSFKELLESGGFRVNSTEDFAAIPHDEFDEHISRATSFDNWEDMKRAAEIKYFERKMGF